MLFEQLHLCSGNHTCKFVLRNSLSSYTSENVIMEHKQRCEQQKITGIRTWTEAHLCWKKLFCKNLLFSRRYADFEADKQNQFSSICKKKQKFMKKNPLCNRYYKRCELNDVLKSDF